MPFYVAAAAAAAVVGGCAGSDQLVAESADSTTEPIATEEILLPYTAPELTMATQPESVQGLEGQDTGRVGAAPPAGVPPDIPELPVLPAGEPNQVESIDAPQADVPSNPELPASPNQADTGAAAEPQTAGP
ncbi:hypothetical protein [Aldersonia kunmingensis]|uniref:hypothetical protein n=1 Tax=Aldersonia kunmingensis TaxID=408066 RepID=UPI0008372E1B|nr:hypothetical protein [Aldersonia kunmingensis]